MPTYARRDDSVRNGLGQAVPNVAVSYYAQPSLSLATIYSDSAGSEVIPNPQFTNGLGQTAAYMIAGLYTITYSGASIQTLTFPDQDVGGGGSSGSSITVFQGGLTGTQDGVNQVFTFAIGIQPAQFTLWQNFPLIDGVGFTWSWGSGTLTIVLTTAPAADDDLYIQGFYES